jgi:type II secretory pathway component PulF
MLMVGERSGNLASTLRRLIWLMDSIAELKKAALPLFAPLALILMACGAVTAFRPILLEEFAKLMPMNTWPSGPRMLWDVSTFFMENWMFLLGGFIAAALIIRVTIDSWVGFGRKFFDHLPPWSLYATISGQVFMLSLSAMINSKIPPYEALKHIRQHATPWMRARVSRLIILLPRCGNQLGRAMKESPYDFPGRDIIDTLDMYGDAHDLDAVMQSIAEESMEMVRGRIKKATTLGVLVGLMSFYGILIAAFAAVQQLITSTTSMSM